jgi:hypothetical protein
VNAATIDALLVKGLSAREIGRRLKVDAGTVSARALRAHPGLKCGCGLSWFHHGRCGFRRVNRARTVAESTQVTTLRRHVEIITADVLGDPPAHRSGLAQKNAQL